MSLPAALPEPTEEPTDLPAEASHVRRRDLLGIRPEDPRRVIDSAIGLHMLGDHSQALDQLEPLTLQLDAVGAEALFISALCHAAEGDPLSAIGCLEVALL